MKHLIAKAAIAVLAVFLSLPMLAAEVEIDGINYELDEKTHKATVLFKRKGSYSGDIVIPESVEHEGATYNVTSIGNEAFFDCNIISVSIPNSVVNIGEVAFISCNELKAVYISDLAAWCHIDFKDFYANPLYYAQHLYLNGEEIKELVIPEGTERIGSYAFKECIGLTSIDIPEGVTEIGERAFEYCSSLTSATLPTTVTSIGEFAFEGCENLTAVYISDIVNWCNIKFDNYYSNPLSYAHKLYLFGELVTELILPVNAQLTSIGDYAFVGCQSLKTITIPEGVTTIGYQAFYHCSKLTSVTLPEGVTNIGNGAFGRCLSLMTINIPEGVDTIGRSTFLECSRLPLITIPSTVTTIGDGAFQLCKGLRDVYCLAGKAPSCEGGAFGDYPLYLPENITLHVPAASIESYKATTPWSEFSKILALPVEKTLVDGEEYENGEDEECANITYTRTLNNTEWNALYLPFEVPVIQLLDKYEVAYINAIHSYDDDENGEIDRMSMEIIKLKNGTLHAHHPYLIKAKTEDAKQMNITVENTTLYKAESKTLDCSSIYTKFEITGIYEKMTSEQLDGCYALSGGKWKNLSPNSVLAPFRLYARITSREGSPVKVSTAAMARIGIHVQGEETATSIEERLMQKTAKAEVVYDLSGRNITKPQKGQVYIVNGKKRMY